MTAPVYKSRVWELGTVTGTGPVALPGVPTIGYRTFSASLGATTAAVAYLIYDTINAAWEVGIGTFDGGSPGTLTRGFTESSTGALVNFAGNQCNIELTIISPVATGTGAADAGLVPALGATGALDPTLGGTGQITPAAGFNALSPITANGDLIVGTGVDTAGRLAIGAANYVLTSNGTTPSWANPIAVQNIYTRTTFTATAGQTVFNATYAPSYVQVYVNGTLLQATEYTATNGTSITLATAASVNDVVEVVAFSTDTSGVATASYNRSVVSATAGQTAFSVSYTAPYLEVYLNGVLLDTSDYTATNGATVTLATGAASGDYVTFIAYNVTNVAVSNIQGGAAGEIVYQSGPSVSATTAAGTAGQALISQGAGAPTWSQLTVDASGNLTIPGTASIAAATASGHAVQRGQVLSANPLGALGSSGPSITTISVTTSTFTAPCKGVLNILCLGFNSASDNANGITVTASLAGIVSLNTNGFGFASYYLPMTSGQSTTLSGTYVNSNAGYLSVAISTFFTPLP